MRFSYLENSWMLMKQLEKLLKNLLAESMVKRLSLQSTKQDTRCSKRRRQCQTHTCFHHRKMLWRCISNFQTMEWKNALSQHSVHLHLNKHGWRITDESTKIRWMNQKPELEILEELTSCCCCKNQMSKQNVQV